jgi:hypothetical protein
MANYNPPTEDITVFNTSLFNQPEVILSQAEADLLYLSKVSSTISTAGLTTFNNGVSVGGNITGSSLIQSNTTSASTNSIYNNLFTGSTLAIGTSNSSNTINGFSTFNNGLLGNLNTNSIEGNGNTGTKTLFTNLTGTLNIGQATTTLVNVKAPTTFDLSVSLKNNRYKISEQLDFTASSTYSITAPFSQTYTIRSSFTSITINLPAITVADAGLIINLVKVQASSNINATINNNTGTSIPAIYALNDLGGGSASNTTLLAANKMSTSLMAAASGSTTYWLEVGTGLTTWDIAQNNLIYPRLTTENNFSNRLNFSAATYSFPFASSQSLGYYLKTTGAAYTSLTTATPRTILTTASIPIGVWRIDFSVINLVTTAGTITQSQTYISTTTDGAIATAVDFTGSVVRSHVSEVYALNDVQEITSSFTYQQTTAGVLRLNIVKSFGSGAYSFTGEISITRLA